MNTYRVRFREGMGRTQIVHADSVNGFKPDSDSYVFMMSGEAVAVMPKAVVVSIEMVKNGETVVSHFDFS